VKFPATTILAAIAALLSVLLFVSVPGTGLWHAVLLNAAHGPILAVVAILVLLLQPPVAQTSRKAYVTAFLTAVGLGVMIEILQSLAQRPGSLFDVMTDAAGAATGLALWALLRWSGASGPTRGTAAIRSWPVAIALAGILVIAWEPLQAVHAYARRAAEFPTIVEFRSERDLAFVHTKGNAAEIVELPSPWSLRRGEHALRLDYDAAEGPAVDVVEPSRDWRGYSTVAIDLTNPSMSELRLTLRIHDASHDWSHEDRLNLPVVIPPGSRMTLRVALATVESAPEGRRMDLARIADVMLFGRPTGQPGSFYVSRLWLE
jgi:hypothetical protein